MVFLRYKIVLRAVNKVLTYVHKMKDKIIVLEAKDCAYKIKWKDCVTLG